ncbi:HNH endonuclease [Sphingomonas sp. LY160]|uniref:HNH endonuclease n=1 Tax=Sphingomonas sp. LY160 TaxID=3095342 RepID=UPI003A10368F
MASKKKSIVKYLNPWMFKRECREKRVQALRQAYGENCWQCGHPMTFSKMPLARRGATIEHLQARSAGGTSEWKNIRLCHKGCNKHLGCQPPEQKVRMRLKLARDVVPEFAPRPSPAALTGSQPMAG